MFFYQDFPSGQSGAPREAERRLLDQALDLQAERRRLEARLQDLQQENPWLSEALSS